MRGGVRTAAAAAFAAQGVSAEASPSARGRSTARRTAAGPSPAWRAALGVLLLPALLTTPLAAQARVTTTIDTTRATVGDRLTMTVTVEHPAGARVVWPDSLDLGAFELLGAEVVPTAQTEPSTRSTAVFTLAAFELGELEIPSFDVEVVDSDGASDTLSTEAWGVEIESVGVDESGEIRDIRGPLGIPMSLLRMLLLALAPLLLVALLYTLARRLRSRDGESEPARAALERPAHEIALEQLATLEGSGMLERGEVKEYHIEVSDVLRTYVERRFRVDALEMTTREVLHGLQRAGADESFREGLGAFLDQCDMVKFAKVRPAPEQSRQVLELGRRIVLRSVPGADEPPTRAAEGIAPAGGATAAAAEAGNEPDRLAREPR